MATNNSINLTLSGVVTYNGSGSFTASTLTQFSTLVGGAANAISSLGVAANGQLVIGSTGASPVLSTLTAGSGISITNAAGSITIASTGSFSWTTVSGTSQAIAASNGYISNNAALVTLTLPATAAVGDTYIIEGLGAGGWQVAQNASQLIHFGNQVTTTGTGGFLASTNQYDCVTINCIVANTTFTVRDSVGNITYN